MNKKENKLINKKNRNAMIGIDKLLVFILVIFVIGIIIFFILKLDVISFFKFLPSFSENKKMPDLNNNLNNNNQNLNLNELDTRRALEYASQNIIYGKRCYCDSECDNYAKIITEVSQKRGIDPLFLTALIIQESNCKWDAKSAHPSDPDKDSIGLMQISNWRMCQEELGLSSKQDTVGKENIANNINCGAIILKQYYNTYGKDGVIFKRADAGKVTSCYRRNDIIYYGWDAALRAYVGFGCPNCPSYFSENQCIIFKQNHDNYVENVNLIYKKLKEEVLKYSS
ncbi:MAG: transglycosylase SLT domain-containing protein [Candidatus Pacearchaeota archaeon]